MNAIKRLLSWLRRLLFKPSTQIGLGILVIIGFAGGVWFWAGFTTALEATNSEEFCLSCHTMEDNMLPELQKQCIGKTVLVSELSVRTVTYHMNSPIKWRVRCKPHVKYCHM